MTIEIRREGLRSGKVGSYRRDRRLLKRFVLQILLAQDRFADPAGDNIPVSHAAFPVG